MTQEEKEEKNDTRRERRKGKREKLSFFIDLIERERLKGRKIEKYRKEEKKNVKCKVRFNSYLYIFPEKNIEPTIL